jgi:hypothetical protein
MITVTLADPNADQGTSSELTRDQMHEKGRPRDTQETSSAEDFQHA